MMAKRSAEEYEAMAAEFEDGDYAAIGPIEAGPELPMGRPVGDASSRCVAASLDGDAHTSQDVR
ncbi:hypothetical protein [Nocardia sp. SSK8]|uniref:hypothetical protein n=1 Tax=Nocardia sp. SSK8 TaxID=3120154 RepID=UPI00300B4B4D